QAHTTWSPGLRSRTSLPTASTIPAPSWPSTTGGGIGSFIWVTDRSEWHTPLATILTTISSSRGAFSFSASTRRGSMKLCITAPLTSGMPPWGGSTWGKAMSYTIRGRERDPAERATHGSRGRASEGVGAQLGEKRADGVGERVVAVAGDHVAGAGDVGVA